MSALPDDRTARARIRDEALRLFADRGADAVAIRDVAASAGVSAALVIRHYRSKAGLRSAIDDHVARIFEAMLTETTSVDRPFDPDAVPGLVATVIGNLPPDSPIPRYLGRMMIDGGPAASALFGRLHALSKERLSVMAGGNGDGDLEVRAALLLVNDLAVLVLRDRIRDVLGADPLSADGLRRWSAEALDIYRDGLGDTTTGT